MYSYNKSLVLFYYNCSIMKYYLSTIADVDFEVVGETEKITYKKRTAPIAQQYGMGLELAEFCISENLNKTDSSVISHFEYNRKSSADSVLHAPYNELFPHAIDPNAVKLAWDRYDMVWNICLKYEIHKIIVHANYVQCLYYPEWFKARNIEFWSRFLSEHPEDITICLENVMETEPSLITDIIKDVNSPRLRMCLDAGHANLTEIKPEDWLRECAEYISHYHIHNNDGPAPGDRPNLGDKHKSLPNGNIDMKSLLTLAEKLTPNASAAVESYGIEESAKWLKENGFI